jgi:hypothetical protein
MALSHVLCALAQDFSQEQDFLESMFFTDFHVIQP